MCGHAVYALNVEHYQLCMATLQVPWNTAVAIIKGYKIGIQYVEGRFTIGISLIILIETGELNYRLHTYSAVAGSKIVSSSQSGEIYSTEGVAKMAEQYSTWNIQHTLILI